VDYLWIVEDNVGKVGLSKYISENFTKAFLTIFLPLFFIGSLVSIVQLSSLTKLIQVDFFEMSRLFGYNLPAMLFYTIPISFLIAITTTLLRLSSENELMALFALGIRSKDVVRRVLISAVLFSILLLLLSIIKMPQAEQQYRAFKTYKITQAKLNISPSQLGQKFGDFFVYLKSKSGNSMKDIVIYTKEKSGSNRLFIAKEAKVENIDSTVSLTLNSGSGYTFSKESLKMVEYEQMKIFQNINGKSYTYKNIREYWERYAKNPKKRGKILFFIFISLIPIIALYIVASFSIINPRYQKSYAYPVLGLTTLLLYVVATLLQNQGSLILLGVAVITTIVIGVVLFHYRVARYF
jgi:lipopolysaccharide export system permease protein